MVNYDNLFLKYPSNPRIVVSLTDSHTLIIFDHELHELRELFFNTDLFLFDHELHELHELFFFSTTDLTDLTDFSIKA